MQTILKRQFYKLTVTFMLVLFLLLSLIFQIARASTPHQTIPTAPPTTAVIPTISFTGTPTNPPQTTVISTQPTQVLPSQTPNFTASPTGKSITSSPTFVPSTTGLPITGTLPSLTETLLPTEGALIAPTSSLLPTATGISAAETPGYYGVLYCLIVGGVVLILAIGIIWVLLRSRRSNK